MTKLGVAAIGLVTLSSAFALAETTDTVQTAEAFTLAQIEESRPKGEVVVRFRVEGRGLVLGGINTTGQLPITLETRAGLKDPHPRSRLQVMVWEKWAEVDIPRDIVGKTVEVRGKVTYHRQRHIEKVRGGEAARDMYAIYSMTVDAANNLRIVPDADE